jgi:hypothetical protein
MKQHPHSVSVIKTLISVLLLIPVALIAWVETQSFVNAQEMCRAFTPTTTLECTLDYFAKGFEYSTVHAMFADELLPVNESLFQESANHNRGLVISMGLSLVALILLTIAVRGLGEFLGFRLQKFRVVVDGVISTAMLVGISHFMLHDMGMPVGVLISKPARVPPPPPSPMTLAGTSAAAMLEASPTPPLPMPEPTPQITSEHHFVFKDIAECETHQGSRKDLNAETLIVAQLTMASLIEEEKDLYSLEFKIINTLKGKPFEDQTFEIDAPWKGKPTLGYLYLLPLIMNPNIEIDYKNCPLIYSKTNADAWLKNETYETNKEKLINSLPPYARKNCDDSKKPAKGKNTFVLQKDFLRLLPNSDLAPGAKCFKKLLVIKPTKGAPFVEDTSEDCDYKSTRALQVDLECKEDIAYISAADGDGGEGRTSFDLLNGASYSNRVDFSADGKWMVQGCSHDLYLNTAATSYPMDGDTCRESIKVYDCSLRSLGGPCEVMWEEKMPADKRAQAYVPTSLIAGKTSLQFTLNIYEGGIDKVVTEPSQRRKVICQNATKPFACAKSNETN